jgi:hypothetical protein
MADRDAWGRDPSVQIMRTVFQAMEQAQQGLLDRLAIPSSDLRLRGWREQALALFERCWGMANRMGISMDPATASIIYCSVLARVMGAAGVEIPEDLVSQREEVARLLKEVPL